MSKPIGQTILFFAEIILGVRMLLFAVPIVLIRLAEHQISWSVVDWVVFCYAVPALFLITTGMLSLWGYARWRFLHYLSVIPALGLASTMFSKLVEAHMPLRLPYFFPFFIAVSILVYLAYSQIEAVRAHPGKG